MKRAMQQVIARQQGVGLAEVLVAMVVGLILLSGVAYAFIGSKQMNTAHADTARMQESARNALDLIGKAVRQAGYQLDVSQDFTADPVTGVNGGGATDDQGLQAVADTLTIVHDPAAVANGGVSGVEVDCEGITVTSNNTPNATTGVVPVNTRYVKYQFTISNNQLICKGSRTAAGAAGVVVADNIENMQVTYGISDGAEHITSYVFAPTLAQLKLVGAVRVSLLVVSPNAGAPRQQSLIYYGGNAGAAETVTDGHMRQVFTSTFKVRNRK